MKWPEFRRRIRVVADWRLAPDQESRACSRFGTLFAKGDQRLLILQEDGHDTGQVKIFVVAPEEDVEKHRLAVVAEVERVEVVTNEEAWELIKPLPPSAVQAAVEVAATE